LEGRISKAASMAELARGRHRAGDLIPWCMNQQYQNSDFLALSGARIVRVATHPDLQRMGYAHRALTLLADYYEGKFANLSGVFDDTEAEATAAAKKKAAKASKKAAKKAAEALAKADAPSQLLSETVAARRDLAPLLDELSDRPPEHVHYVGASFGLTQGLFNFWRKCSYVPVYVRQTSNDLTGEHSCIMLRSLGGTALETVESADWLDSFAVDFRRRVLQLFSFQFKAFTTTLGLSLAVSNPGGATGGVADAAVATDAAVALVDAAASSSSSSSSKLVAKTYSSGDLGYWFTEFDLKRLEAYSRNLVDYHLILDLVPSLARLFFLSHLGVRLSYTQSAILFGIGLQHKSVTDLCTELNLSSTQMLALFNKAIRKLVKYIQSLEEAAAAAELQTEAATIEAEAEAAAAATTTADGKGGKKSKKKKTKAMAMAPLQTTLAEEERAGGSAALKAMKSKQLEMLQSMNLSQFSVGGTDDDWKGAERAVANGGGGHVSIKADGARDGSGDAERKKKKSEKRSSDAHKHRPKFNDGDGGGSQKRSRGDGGGGSSKKKKKFKAAP
jgi:N-acetyltransferase 10